MEVVVVIIGAPPGEGANAGPVLFADVWFPSRPEPGTPIFVEFQYSALNAGNELSYLVNGAGVRLDDYILFCLDGDEQAVKLIKCDLAVWCVLVERFVDIAKVICTLRKTAPQTALCA